MSEICKTKQEAEKVLHEIIKYIAEYKSYYGYMNEIKVNKTAENHPITQNITDSVFGMAYRSFEFNILSNLYRIYIENSDSIDIFKAINAIRKNIDNYEDLQETEKENIKTIISELHQERKSLDKSVKTLSTLRNKRLAHFDTAYFLDSDRLFNESSLTLKDFNGLMDFADKACRLLYPEITNGKGINTDPLHSKDVGKIYEVLNTYYNIPISERLKLKHNKEQPT